MVAPIKHLIIKTLRYLWPVGQRQRALPEVELCARTFIGLDAQTLSNGADKLDEFHPIGTFRVVDVDILKEHLACQRNNEVLLVRPWELRILSLRENLRAYVQEGLDVQLSIIVLELLLEPSQRFRVEVSQEALKGLPG